MRQLLSSLDDVPAFVLGRRMDVLAWDRLAAALMGDFDAMDPAERNIPRMLFLDPSARDLFPE